jgi:NADH/F420H2 dehydrogenase subunit C
MNSILKNYGSYFASFLQSSIIIVRFTRTGDLVFKVFKDNFVPFVFFAKHFGLALFKHINDYTAIDYPEKKNRFELALHLTSINFNSRIRVKTTLNEMSSIQTISHIYKSANWLEREIFDCYGITFYKHEDLRRILTDYGFVGYPFRKDFPLSGFLSARYNDLLKRVCFEKNEFAQEFRIFNSLSS